MTDLYFSLAKFQASIASASNIALKIFLASAFAVLAYHCLDYLPAAWRPFVKLIAWIYAVLLIAGSIYYSIGAS